MPLGPEALRERALERADAISTIVINEDEVFSAGYWNSRISERSGKKGGNFFIIGGN
jgi:hypothetical protein